MDNERDALDRLNDKPENKIEDIFIFHRCIDCELDHIITVDGIPCWKHPKGDCQKSTEGDDNKPAVLGHVVLDDQEVDRIADAVVDRIVPRIVTILTEELSKLAPQIAQGIMDTPLNGDCRPRDSILGLAKEDPLEPHTHIVDFDNLKLSGLTDKENEELLQEIRNHPPKFPNDIAIGFKNQPCIMFPKLSKEADHEDKSILSGPALDEFEVDEDDLCKIGLDVNTSGAGGRPIDDDRETPPFGFFERNQEQKN